MKLLSRALVLLWADQVSKLFIRELMQPYDSIQVLPFFRIEYLHNRGIAFGMLKGHTAAIIFMSIVVVALLVLAGLAVRHDGRWTWSFALLGAGSVGNLVDRVWLGGVTDFLGFSHWPTFNFADIFIVTGVLLLVKTLFWQASNPQQVIQREKELRKAVTALFCRASHPQRGEELWYECEETSWAGGEQAPWPQEDEGGKMKSEPRPEEKEATAPKLVS